MAIYIPFSTLTSHRLRRIGLRSLTMHFLEWLLIDSESLDCVPWQCIFIPFCELISEWLGSSPRFLETSIGGSVLEFSPATREAWVRFRANAIYILVLTVTSHLLKSPVLRSLTMSLVTFLTDVFRWYSLQYSRNESDLLRVYHRQALVVQWQNSRLPRGRPGFDSRPIQCIYDFGQSLLIDSERLNCVPWQWAWLPSWQMFFSDILCNVLWMNRNFSESIIGKHWWFSGRILACHAGGPGSIPGQWN